MANNNQLINEAIEELQVSGETELAVQVIEAWTNGELLTFGEWKKKGYSVIKGQKSMFSCNLWKKLSKAEMEKEKKRLEEKAKLEGTTPKKPSSFVKTKCCFFLPTQVQPIKKEVAV